MQKTVAFSHKNLTLEDVDNFYKTSLLSIDNFYLFIQNGIATIPARLIGKTIAEIREDRKSILDELDKSVCLNLLASIEASFKVDFIKRVNRKDKENISREFRKLHKKKLLRISLEDDILELWKDHYPRYRSILSEFKSAFNYRHWLAHGIYVTPKLGRKYEYQDIYTIAAMIYCNIPLKKPISN